MVNISWEKGEGADMGTLGTLKEKTELPLHAPKPALEVNPYDRQRISQHKLFRLLENEMTYLKY